MREIKQFDDATIEKLFGADDAENEMDERFKEYFYYNKVFDNLNNELPIRLLVGHKGIGKSALLKRAYLADTEKNRLAIRLQPGDILGFGPGPDSSNFNYLVEQWKDGLLSTIAQKVLEEFSLDVANKNGFANLGKKVSQFLPLLSGVITKSAKKIGNETSAAIIQ